MYDLPVNGTSMNGSVCDERDPLRPIDEILSIWFFEDNFNLKFTFGYHLDLNNGDREWYIKEISLVYPLNSRYFPGYSGDNVTGEYCFQFIVTSE